VAVGEGEGVNVAVGGTGVKVGVGVGGGVGVGAGVRGIQAASKMKRKTEYMERDMKVSLGKFCARF